MANTKWCCHPTRHQSDRRMGPDGPGKHRKGKNRISVVLAEFLNDSYRLLGSDELIDATSDLLCTSCFTFEAGRLESVTSSEKTDSVEVPRSSLRAAAVLANRRISDQNRIDSTNYAEETPNHASDDLDDETVRSTMIERRVQAVSVLNAILDLLSQKRIEDIRNQNIVRAQMNKMILTIRGLAENVVLHVDSEITPSCPTFDWTLDEGEELIQGLKQLVVCSDYVEQIRLLTLAPRDWGRWKVQSFFHCSERQARYAVHLRDSDRKLHRPVDLRGNLPFDPQVEKKIFDFYHDDLISRVRR